MDRHCANALRIAKWLSDRKDVLRVHYPGLAHHPQHQLAAKQMKRFGGMISFDLGSYAAAASLLGRVRLCALAESLGGVETIISHPATMSHASVPPEIRRQIGVTDGLIRLSVGIEDVEDIIDDLDNALNAGKRERD